MAHRCPVGGNAAYSFFTLCDMACAFVPLQREITIPKENMTSQKENKPDRGSVEYEVLVVYHVCSYDEHVHSDDFFSSYGNDIGPDATGWESKLWPSWWWYFRSCPWDLFLVSIVKKTSLGGMKPALGASSYYSSSSFLVRETRDDSMWHSCLGKKRVSHKKHLLKWH